MVGCIVTLTTCMERTFHNVRKSEVGVSDITCVEVVEREG